IRTLSSVVLIVVLLVELPWRRRREAVEPRAEDLETERGADRADGLRAEGVAAEPDDPAVLLLHAEDLLERLAPPPRAEAEHERFPVENAALQPRRLVGELRRPLRVPVHRVLEPAALPGEGGATDVDAAPHVLDRPR